MVEPGGVALQPHQEQTTAGRVHQPEVSLATITHTILGRKSHHRFRRSCGSSTKASRSESCGSTAWKPGRRRSNTVISTWDDCRAARSCFPIPSLPKNVATILLRIYLLNFADSSTIFTKLNACRHQIYHLISLLQTTIVYLKQGISSKFTQILRCPL